MTQIKECGTKETVDLIWAKSCIFSKYKKTKQKNWSIDFVLQINWDSQSLTSNEGDETENMYMTKKKKEPFACDIKPGETPRSVKKIRPFLLRSKHI